MNALRLIPLLAALSCGDEDEGTYVLFNHEGDSMEIHIGAELMGAHTIELKSSTGDNVVGTATVDPQGAPCGTEHTMVVIVADEYENLVDRVTVVTDSPDRGIDEYSMVQDSADEGYYKLSLQSTGAEDEERIDTLTFRLYEFVEDSG